MKNKNNWKKQMIFAIILFVFFLVIYICGMVISQEDIEGSFLNAGRSPDFQHPFGTDALGRDLFLRTIKGLSVSITIGFWGSLFSGIISLLVGVIAATGSKRTDAFINWIIDLVMSIPHTIFIILISFVLGRGIKGLLVGIAVTHWCGLARLIRGEMLQLRSKQYVELSKKLGKTRMWIFVHHFLPHLVPQFLIGLILMFPHAILHEAAISFLGFGLPPEQPAIGIILSESMRYLSVGMWWIALLPGLTLTFLVLLIDKMGEYVKLIFEPRYQRGKF